MKINLHPKFLAKTTERFVKTNAPVILTVVGAAGVGVTAYFAGVGTVKAVRILDQEKFDRMVEFAAASEAPPPHLKDGAVAGGTCSGTGAGRRAGGRWRHAGWRWTPPASGRRGRSPAAPAAPEGAAQVPAATVPTASQSQVPAADDSIPAAPAAETPGSAPSEPAGE